MLLTTAILLLNSFTGLIIQISGEFKKSPHFAVFEIICLLLLTYIFYQYYGDKGVIFALFFSSLPSFIYGLNAVKTILNMNYIRIAKENALRLGMMCLILPIVNFTIGSSVESAVAKLILETFTFIFIFILIQWRNLPLEIKQIFRRN